MSNTFRMLNDNEKQAINAFIRKGKINDNHPILFNGFLCTSISYERIPGGFCVCIILVRSVSVDSEYLIYRGASRRSDIRGEMIAFNRAILYSPATEV